MDKVIIDGIDVSGCEHFGIDSMELCKINFDNNYFSNGIPCAEKCSNHSNCYYKQLQRLKHQYADVLKLAKENADSNEYCLQELEQENERLKAELKKYEDMAKKGLEEFKDVGGCWGCGLQLQLNQDMEDIRQLKAECERLNGLLETKCQSEWEKENEQLKAENERLKKISCKYKEYCTCNTEKYVKCLQEIKAIAEEWLNNDWSCYLCRSNMDEKLQDILAKINEVIGAEE